MSDEETSYASAGVDIAEATRALNAVREAIERTYGDRVVGGLGAFGGMFRSSFPDLQNPLLVSSIDGVGTKTAVAQMVGDYSGIGRDIVHHCVNDILCQGARPLFFLDYFGCSSLPAKAFEQVVASAAAACEATGCALIGGETAEMPGVYREGEIDVVGCIVGVVEFDKRLPRPCMGAGDRLIGLASSGLHTNGFSLARKALFEIGGASVDDLLPGSDVTTGSALLAPHTCYLSALDPLLKDDLICGLAHITGGGIPDNTRRITPDGLQAVIERGAWTLPAIFSEIQERGGLSGDDMMEAFNMGIGMIAVVKPDSATEVRERLSASGQAAFDIGELQPGEPSVKFV
ncbi:MAG: phosphoribosylformylglycinamidine cyclo-ligase [Armatimonadetes bacterium]|nr:phosphoribosylformylglycinamidine cyclo-ligase [Armatimonadota bacterium]